MKKQRWKFTKGEQYKCSRCGYKLDKRYLPDEEKRKNYIYCSDQCYMYHVGMSWSDFA
ncbi:hypothetical protein [Priestia megaterium]|uniref:hypothetical protein n=1 Tax=Priestia megaterium TaxID=1404 RepID=UPI003CC556FD